MSSAFLLNFFISTILTNTKRICYNIFVKNGGSICSQLKWEVIKMGIGERIRFIRNLRGMTQKFLGLQVGFSERTADIRMAQYESEAREPKAALIEQMASIFKVSPKAISVPEIDTYDGLMHTFFALEDMYGLKIAEIDGELCLHLDRTLNPDMNLYDLLELWHKQSMRLANGLITKQDYDEWRYNYPASQAALEQAAREKGCKNKSANSDE